LLHGMTDRQGSTTWMRTVQEPAGATNFARKALDRSAAGAHHFA
jgi:hypothetical protein